MSAKIASATWCLDIDVGLNWRQKRCVLLTSRSYGWKGCLKLIEASVGAEQVMTSGGRMRLRSGKQQVEYQGGKACWVACVPFRGTLPERLCHWLRLTNCSERWLGLGSGRGRWSAALLHRESCCLPRTEGMCCVFCNQHSSRAAFP